MDTCHGGCALSLLSPDRAPTNFFAEEGDSAEQRDSQPRCWKQGFHTLILI